MRHGVDVHRGLLDRNVERNRFKEVTARRREDGQSLCRLWRLIRDVLRDTFSDALKVRSCVCRQRALLLVEAVAKERVDMEPTTLVRSHVEIEADDRALRRLDGGQTVQLLAKRSFQCSRAFRSHTPRFASCMPPS